MSAVSVSPILVLALAAGLGPIAPGYSRVGESHGVTVYRHEGDRPLGLMGEGLIDGPPERVRAVLLDYESHPRFLRHMAEIRVLSRTDRSLLVYQRLKMPVLADRDMVLRVTWGADGEVLWTHFACAPPAEAAQVPPRPGVVRVTDHEGGWRLQPATVNGGPATIARYQMHMDMGGSVPQWMVRSGAARDVPELFEAIRGQVRQRR